MEIIGKDMKKKKKRLDTKNKKETDLVILPGDFSWSTYLSDTKEDFEYLNSLPGKKTTIKKKEIMITGGQR